MTSRQHEKRNRNGTDPQNHRLLTLRTAFVVLVALLTGIGGAVLLYLAHRSPSLIVLSAIGIFAVALKFFDDLID